MSHVLCRLASILFDKFNTPLDLLDIFTHVPFAKCDAAVQQTHVVEVKKIKYFDWQDDEYVSFNISKTFQDSQHGLGLCDLLNLSLWRFRRNGEMVKRVQTKSCGLERSKR